MLEAYAPRTDVGLELSLFVVVEVEGELSKLRLSLLQLLAYTRALPLERFAEIPFFPFAASLQLLSRNGRQFLRAWLKLRQRNLGPILDANGWAVNGQVKLNVPFGASLTKVAELPANAGTSLAVKYPEPPTALPKLVMTLVGIAFVLSLLNHFGVISTLTGGRFGAEPATAARVESPTPGVP